MPHADAAIADAPADLPSSDRLEHFAVLALFGVAASVNFSIAVAQSLLALAILGWVGLLIWRREPIEVPRFFWPLAVYAVLTLVSAAFSPQRPISLMDTKQLVLFLIVPLTYRLASGNRGTTMITVLVSVGAASAAIGIFQYGLLHYDNLGLRPRGTLGHWMTYSGLLMLVICTALARILFGRRDRLWASLVMPALAVAVVVTFTRSSWVGACVAAALLFSLKDFRLLAILPILAAVFFAAAPPAITARFMSIFDRNNPTNLDRIAMIREGEHMIRAHPLLGVGPNMVEVMYSDYRDPDSPAVINPHLHNVPLQIAAERGLPALGAWLWFVTVVLMDLWRMFKAKLASVPAAAALAAMVAMLAAGMFEYNFGDSEFLMLLLILVTLPFAAVRRPLADHTS
jgi:O-antigen ligase